MKICGVCKADLGIFTKKHACFDGYICDECFQQAKLPASKRSCTSINEIKKRIFNKENVMMEEQNKIKVQHADAERLAIEKKLTDYEGIIKIGFENFKFKLYRSETIFDFEQLLSFEYIEIEHLEQKSVSNTKVNNGISRSIVGGLIAGDAGAIVGAGTARTTIKTEGVINKFIDKMQIRLVIAPNAQVYTLDFLTTPTAIGSDKYNLAYEKAQRILSLLNKIEKSNKDKVTTQETSRITQHTEINNHVSTIEQIKQYKELLDIGAITQEEYNFKKKQLLGL